ncbi:MAG TPA: tape measure protein [Candidatus Gemmiger excrementavium]|uniref:Tape measure protein n=1 Tax=Candidatus Gemmiger excrementavium TaxID=2838608 RepID=A0A9D2F150_9FIRM|nr:tape measure protein [Candidatus Gemmiger excrementavium]
MAVNIGPKIGIDGEAKYRAQINNIIQQAKTLDSEMRAVTSGFDEQTDAMTRTTSVTRILTQQISVQEQRIQKLSEMLDKSAQKYGENDDRTLKWRQAVNEATASLNKMQGELKQTANETDDLGDEMEQTSRQVSSLGDIIQGTFVGNLISDAVSNLVNMLGELGGEALTAADSLTKFEGTMEFAGFDPATIQETKAAMQDYADRTVYDLETVANTTAQLAANGVADFEALTEAAGNLNSVAGGNANTFSSLAMVLTQTAGAGKLTTENWNQLTDAIPGASGVLQQAMLDAGAYTGNFREAMENGEISAEEFMDAIKELGSTTEAQNAATSVSTIEGAVGNLRATVSGFITSFLTEGGGMEVITTAINGVTTAFQNLTQNVDWASFKTTLQNAFATIIPLVQQFVNFVIDNWPMISSVIIGAGIAKLIGGITTAVLALNTAMMANPIGLVIAAISAVIALLVNLALQNENLKTSFDEGVAELAAWVDSVKTWFANLDAWLDQTLGNFFNVVLPGAINSMVTFVQEKFTQIGEFFSTLWQGIVDSVVSFGEGIIQTASDIVTALKEKINSAIDFIKSLPEKFFQWGADMINGLIEGIKSIDIGAAIGGVADTIASFIHFSRPDTGPLREYETWMPDMMAGLARGIRENQYLVTNALAGVARGMEGTLSPSLAVPTGRRVVVQLGNVTFYGYTPDQGDAFVRDLNRKLGRLL